MYFVDCTPAKNCSRPLCCLRVKGTRFTRLKLRSSCLERTACSNAMTQWKIECFLFIVTQERSPLGASKSLAKMCQRAELFAVRRNFTEHPPSISLLTELAEKFWRCGILQWVVLIACGTPKIINVRPHNASYYHEKIMVKDEGKKDTTWNTHWTKKLMPQTWRQ